MCGRFDCHSDLSVIQKEFNLDQVISNYQPSYNIAPSRQIIIIKDDGKRYLVQCQWGFIPAWAKDSSIGYSMINARAETVSSKPAFRHAFMKQRCLVVADGFYEWRKEGKLKIPVYVRLKTQRPIGFAGLYNTWTSPEGKESCTCTIITTEANELLSSIHDRMPGIIPKEKEELWLNPKIKDTDKLMPLITPYPSEEMECYEVSSLINKPGYDLPEAIIPI